MSHSLQYQVNGEHRHLNPAMNLPMNTRNTRVESDLNKTEKFNNKCTNLNT